MIRRVLIFAPTIKEATKIATKKGYSRDLWRFVTGEADIADLNPQEWATIVVPGFQKGRPQAWRAYQDMQQKARGRGVRMVSYDP